MKRDMDLCRKILEIVEAESDGLTPFSIEIKDYSETEISYHVMLLDQGGFLEANDMSDRRGLQWLPRRLTWEGHELLDAIRNDTVWIKVKEAVKEKGGSIPFEVLKALAVKVAGVVFGLG